MSPFSHFLHDFRMRHGIRQVDLAERVGYEQSYVSALESGLKGPPTQEFIERLISALNLSIEEAQALQAAAEASQRKLVIDPDTPQEVYWLVNRLRKALPTLSPTQVRMISDVLSFPTADENGWKEPRRRLSRQPRKEAAM